MFIKCLAAILICLHLVSGQDTCTCVAYHLCNNTDREGIIDIIVQPDDCPNYLETCCPLKDVIVTTKSPPTPLKILGCGYTNPDNVGYRNPENNDNEARFGELPWMVAIYHKAKTDQNYTFNCGGSLIHPQVVLTAAHCADHGGSIKIRAGEWDTKTTQEIYEHQDRDVSSVVIHPMFKRASLQYDVALLFLATPIDLTYHIKLACLPPPNTVVTSSRCLVSGWGKDRVNQPNSYQTILKKIELPVVAHEQCQSDFKKTRLGKRFRLHSSFMCAGGEGKNVCIGDGGGPLVCPIEGEQERYHQAGIVSWGIGCGTKDVPGAFVNVTVVRSWIDEQVKTKNLDISVYQY